jgi:hypothetical protein
MRLTRQTQWLWQAQVLQNTGARPAAGRQVGLTFCIGSGQSNAPDAEASACQSGSQTATTAEKSRIVVFFVVSAGSNYVGALPRKALPGVFEPLSTTIFRFARTSGSVHRGPGQSAETRMATGSAGFFIACRRSKDVQRRPAKAGLLSLYFDCCALHCSGTTMALSPLHQLTRLGIVNAKWNYADGVT